MTIIWYMVPEIWSTTDIFFVILDHFLPFLWFLKYEVWWTEFFVILDHFLHFYPSNNLKNQNFEKMKKPVWDLITLHLRTINDSHMMYGSWYMKCNEQNFFVNLDHFLHFYPTNNPKNQNSEKMKKPLGNIIILHLCTINDNHMMYGSWDIKHDGQNFLSLWTIFCPFTLLTTQNIKILKKMKNTPGDIILHMCTINDNHMMYGFWDIERDRQIFLSFWTIFSPFTP